jgi:hypothetical protein
MTGGAESMSEQNAIDAYYSALVSGVLVIAVFTLIFRLHNYFAHIINQTNTWTSMGGPFGGETPERSGQNGPYPTSCVSLSIFPPFFIFNCSIKTLVLIISRTSGVSSVPGQASVTQRRYLIAT